MSRSDYAISGLDLTEDSYTAEQTLVRNKHRAVDADGEVVLRGKQKMFKLKEGFPFVDGDGEDVFTVNAGGIVDVASNYVLIDERTEEGVVVLDNDYSLL